MSILSDFEDRIASAIEGVFAGAFRSPVQPAEIAKELARTMDDARLVGVGSIYVPASYTVLLSPDDARSFGSLVPTLEGELATYLTGHARERGYRLDGRVRVTFATDDGLRLGRFRIRADEAAQRRSDIAAPTLATVSVVGGDHDYALDGEQVVIGRLAHCQIPLADANVSRRHAALIRLEDGWAIQDLGSTNGTRVNGKPVTRARLHDGDIIEVGLTQLVFHEPRS